MEGVVVARAEEPAAVSDVTQVDLKRCTCCELDWPVISHFRWNKPYTSVVDGNGRQARANTTCKACDSGGGSTKPARRKRRKDVDLAWLQANARDWFTARDLGIKHRPLQTDISVACALIGAEPGPDLRKRNAPAETSGEVAARRQERFEREPAKETRQVRRARERRLVKDARASYTRQMTDAEVTTSAIDRSMAARARARGGAYAPQRRRKAVAWNLEPTAVERILKEQGYRCALTGEKFRESTEYGTMNPFGPSPNRINPGEDYTAENCEFVCWWVNRLIGDMPRAKALEFLKERKLLRKGVGQMPLL